MKQKIILEIENNTGVEFEERVEFRPLRRGEYWFNGYDRIAGPIESDYGVCRHILTPKVDHELEEAKKLIGKWVKYKDRDVILKVQSVLRDSYSKALTFEAFSQSGNLAQFYLHDFNTFPLPVWRCCESDKPKKEGTRYVRDKENHSIRGVFQYNLKTETWNGMLVLSRLEWLDEGGE